MALDPLPLFPGVPGGMELAVILLIAVLLFGANKIPKLARSTGQAMGEFKKGRQEIENELNEMRGEVDEMTDMDADMSDSAQAGSTQSEPDQTEPEIGAESSSEPEPEIGEEEPETETAETAQEER